MALELAAMRPDDYDGVVALWQQSEGVGQSPGETREWLASYLDRNPGLSRVARHERRLVGAVLCGHDGRRGYLYHLAVAPAQRGRGVGRALVEDCLSRLAALGIARATVCVFGHNEAGLAFWRRLGWRPREDLNVLQQDLS